MQEGDLEPKEAAARLGVDQLGALLGQIGERDPHVVDLVGHVMHSGPTLREEPPDGCVFAERGEQLDAAPADTHRPRLAALILDPLSLLEPAAEQPLVGRDRLVEIGHRDSDVMNAPCLHEDDVTVAPVPQRFVIGLLALVTLIAGCGGGSKSNGEAAKPPEQVLLDAKQAALDSKAGHVSAAIIDAGKPITLDLTLVKGAGGKGTMTESKLSFEIVRVGQTAYIKGSDAFLRRFAGAAGALLLHGRWIQGSATHGELAALAPLTDVSKLFKGALGSHGKLKNEGE